MTDVVKWQTSFAKCVVHIRIKFIKNLNTAPIEKLKF